MAIFSRYARVNEPDGAPMRVRSALSLINQVLDETLSQLEGNVSPATRFCVEWFKQYGFDAGPFGIAEVLSRSVDTDVSALERVGLLKSRAGRVRLTPVEELRGDYDLANDDRASEWMLCLYLAGTLQTHGITAVAHLMASIREANIIDFDSVRELAYLLYSNTCSMQFLFYEAAHQNPRREFQKRDFAQHLPYLLLKYQFSQGFYRYQR